MLELNLILSSLTAIPFITLALIGAVYYWINN
jgi:hypothetical protein